MKRFNISIPVPKFPKIKLRKSQRKSSAQDIPEHIRDFIVNEIKRQSAEDAKQSASGNVNDAVSDEDIAAYAATLPMILKN